MAVLVGYVQQAWNATGQATLTYPAGTTAGHMALAEASHSDSRSPLPSSWRYAGESIYWKMLEAADITAGSVKIKGYLTSLTVLSGAAGIGRTNDDNEVRVSSASGGLFVRGWTSRWRSSLAGSGATPYRLGAETTSAEDNHKHAVYFRPATAAGYLWLPDADDDAEFKAYEILGPAAPLAPRLTAPAAGAQVDRAAPVALAFDHQSAAGLSMQRAKVLIRVAGGTWGSVTSTGTIAAGVTDSAAELVLTEGKVTVAAGVLAANTNYEWAVLTQDAGGWSPQSATRTFVARSKPTAVVSWVTTHGDRSPTVTATITPGTGTPRGYYLRVCLAADVTPDMPLWESGLIPTTSAAVSVDLPATIDWTNSASYQVWLLPIDSALSGLWTASNAAAVSWTPPGAPVSFVAADGQPPTGTIAGIPGPTVRVDVWSVEDATTRIAIMSPAASVVVGLPLSPYRVARTYQTRAWAYVDGVLVSSAWVTSNAVTSSDEHAYLVAAGQEAEAYVQLTMLDASPPTPIQGYASSSGLGAVEPSVDRTPVSGWRAEWAALTGTAAAEGVLLGWLTDPDRPQIWHKPKPERPLGGAPLVALPAFLAAVDAAPNPARLANTNTAGRRITWMWVTQAEEDD